uniref:Uncharacterized protein n=1 Tax=Aegilops tauschii subsp. strangulata TaxID=200361 RepID=A0A453MUR8_AEGTS
VAGRRSSYLTRRMPPYLPAAWGHSVHRPSPLTLRPRPHARDLSGDGIPSTFRRIRSLRMRAAPAAEQRDPSGKGEL